MVKISALRTFLLQAGLQGLAATLLLAIPFLPAWAGLGDVAASVRTDQVRMRGVLHSVDRKNYVLHEITSPSGTVAREFVTPDGTVFGVTWEGSARPDLRQLLGPYYRQAVAAQARQPRPRGAPLVIETPELVIHESGHMRSFHGQAYLPARMPQGVRATDIR
jgi:hypothetical protein